MFGRHAQAQAATAPPVRLGMRARMAFFFAGLLLVVNLIVLATQRRPIVEAFEHDLQVRGEELALNLAARAAAHVDAGRPEALHELVDGFHEFADVSAVDVRRETGEVLAAKPRSEEEPGARTRPSPGEVGVRRTAYGYEFTAAIAGTDAVAVLSLGEQTLAETIDHIGLTIMLIAAAAVGAGFLLVFAAAGAFVRPIRNLAELARRIRAGELGARIRTERLDEVGELTTAMNAMSAELYEKDAGLRRAVRAMEGQNEELRLRGRDLARQARNLETLVSSLAEGVVYVGLDRRIAIVNEAAAHIVGEPAAELRDRLLSDLRFAASDARLQGLLEEALDHADRDETFHSQVCLSDHLHTVCTVHGPHREPLGVLAVMQDLSRIRDLETEQKELQDQLYHQEKMAIVGLLAASLAHELNTPLATILLQTQCVARELDGAEGASGLVVVEQQVRRCRDIVRRLLDFSRIADSRPAPLDLAGVLESSVSLAQVGVRREGVSIRRFVSRDAPMVHADAHQIEQVLMNLIGNAVDAMPNGGYVDLRLRARNGGAELAVCDDGRGIPAEDRERVFEPFFTTKPRGRGTGLGLSICRRIVEEHRGSIEIRPGGSGGTDVVLQLPAVEVDGV